MWVQEMGDKINQVGKTLRKTSNEVNYNIRRGAENFPTPEITVKDFNKLFTYSKKFEARSDATVKLNVRLKEITTPCSINPPILNKWCRVKFNTSGVPGTMLEVNGEFILEGSNIVVPDNGCYGVTWASGTHGVSYFSNQAQYANFYHNGKIVKSVAKPTTGFIAILGPSIWVYPSIPHLYQVIEAKAGDTISASLDADDFNQCYPWVAGTCLGGGLFSGLEDTTLKIDLIALAESV